MRTKNVNIMLSRDLEIRALMTDALNWNSSMIAMRKPLA
jgi:hypothetical protein